MFKAITTLLNIPSNTINHLSKIPCYVLQHSTHDRPTQHDPQVTQPDNISNQLILCDCNHPLLLLTEPRHHQHPGHSDQSVQLSPALPHLCPVASLSHTRCWYMVSLCREVVVGIVEVSRVRTPWTTIERSWRQQLGSDKRSQMELIRSGEREVMLVWICSQTPMTGGPALLRK